MRSLLLGRLLFFSLTSVQSSSILGSASQANKFFVNLSLVKNSKVLAQPVSGMASSSLANDPPLYLKAGLWNIRTLNSAENRELLSNTLFSKEFDLIALAETHLTSNSSSEIEVTVLDRIQGLATLEGGASRSLCGTEQPDWSTARRLGRVSSSGHLTESNRNSAGVNRAHLKEGVGTRTLCRNEVPAASAVRDTGTPGSLKCQVACETVANSSRDNGERNRGGLKTVNPIPPTSSNSAQSNLTLSGIGSTQEEALGLELLHRRKEQLQHL